MLFAAGCALSRRRGRKLQFPENKSDRQPGTRCHVLEVIWSYLHRIEPPPSNTADKLSWSERASCNPVNYKPLHYQMKSWLFAERSTITGRISGVSWRWFPWEQTTSVDVSEPDHLAVPVTAKATHWPPPCLLSFLLLSERNNGLFLMTFSLSFFFFFFFFFFLFFLLLFCLSFHC